MSILPLPSEDEGPSIASNVSTGSSRHIPHLGTANFGSRTPSGDHLDTGSPTCRGGLDQQPERTLPGCVQREPLVLPPAALGGQACAKKPQPQRDFELLERQPDADAAAGTGSVARLLLNEQRELRRQVEEWVRQLLHGQEQLLRQTRAQRSDSPPVRRPPQPPPQLDSLRRDSEECSLPAGFTEPLSTGASQQRKRSPKRSSIVGSSLSSFSASSAAEDAVPEVVVSDPQSPQQSPTAMSTPAGARGPQRRRSTTDLLISFVAPQKVSRSSTKASCQSVVMEAAAWRRALWRFVHSRAFTLFIVAMIAVNSVFVAIEMDTNAKNQVLRLRGSDQLSETGYVGLAFSLVFSVEVMLRIIAERWYFIHGSERHWNFFDIVLVSIGLMAQVFKCAWGDERALLLPNATACRILRVVSLLKASQVPWFTETIHNLRLLLFLTLGSVKQLLRALAILFFVMYIFGLVFLYGVVQHLEGMGADSASVARLEGRFGSFPAVLLTLFMAVSGGTDWGRDFESAHELGGGYGVIFIFYVTFVVVGVLNVVTGVFVDSAWQMAQADRDVAVAEQMAHKENYMHELRELFYEADADDSGSLSWNEFKDHLKDERVKAYLSSLELDVTQARGLFKLLDVDGSDEVGIDNFVAGCMRLKGAAKSIDVCTLLYENRKMGRVLGNQVKALQVRLDGLANAVSGQRQRGIAPLDLGKFSTAPAGLAKEDDDITSAISNGELLMGQSSSKSPSGCRTPRTPFSARGHFGPWSEDGEAVPGSVPIT